MTQATLSRLSGVFLLAFVLATLEAFVIEGWGCLRLWDLSPAREQLTTAFPFWVVTLLVARLTAGPPGGTRHPRIRLLLACIWVFVIITFATLSIASFMKLGHFLSHHHLRFGVDNFGRLNLHLLQTAPRLLLAFFFVVAIGSLGLVWVLRNTALNERMGGFFAKVCVALVLLSVAHWFCGFLEGRWPKSFWASLIPPPAFSDTDAVAGGSAFSHWLPRPAERGLPQYPENKFPVIVILVESLRGDLLSKYPDVIPFLRRLGREGVVFEKAYAPASHSDYSDLSIWYSRYPLLSGARTVWRAEDPRRGVSAFGVFKALGYFTAYISSQNEKWGNMIQWLQVPEVDFFFHSEDFRGATWENWDDLPGLVSLIKKGLATAGKVEDSKTLEVALKWIDSRKHDEAFFLGMNLQNTHFHYVYPPNAERLFRPDEIDFGAVYYTWPKDRLHVVKNRYLNAVYNLDRLLAWFSDELRKRGLWEKCFFVVAGDNGEAFYEHGFGNHSGPMYEECVRTLVVMKPPAGVHAPTPKQPVNLIDLIPGILHLLGVAPPGDFQGVSPFLEPHPRRQVYLHSHAFVVQDGIVSWPWKLLLTRWPQKQQELYNLESDPQEGRNLWEENHVLASQLSKMLSRFREEQLAYWLFPQNWKIYFPPRFLASEHPD